MIPQLAPIGWGSSALAQIAVVSRGAGYAGASASSHSVPLPGSLVAGTLLFMVLAVANGTTITTPSGWTLVDSQSVTGGRIAAYTKVATGAEGSTVSVSISTSDNLFGFTWQLSGWDGVTPTFSTIAGGTNAAPDPGSVSFGTASKSTLVVAACRGSNTRTVTAAPSGYTNLNAQAVSFAEAGAAESALSSGSAENPGAFTLSGSTANGWAAMAYAIQGQV